MGHGPGLGALIGGIGAAGDLAEEVLRQLPRLVDGDPAVAVDQTRLLRAFRPPSPARVVDEEGFATGGWMRTPKPRNSLFQSIVSFPTFSASTMAARSSSVAVPLPRPTSPTTSSAQKRGDLD